MSNPIFGIFSISRLFRQDILPPPIMQLGKDVWLKRLGCVWYFSFVRLDFFVWFFVLGRKWGFGWLIRRQWLFSFPVQKVWIGAVWCIAPSGEQAVWAPMIHGGKKCCHHFRHNSQPPKWFNHGSNRRRYHRCILCRSLEAKWSCRWQHREWMLCLLPLIVATGAALAADMRYQRMAMAGIWTMWCTYSSKTINLQPQCQI